jgi:hypothetical protein
VRPLTFPVAFVAATAIIAHAGAALADVSSWLALGGGYGAERNHATAATDSGLALTASVGVGSPPRAPLVLGGLLRSRTTVGLGSDVGLAVRACTGGFARGDWGLALDAGAAWRPWRGGDYGEWPLQAVLTAGSPWGFQLALGGDVASASAGIPARGFFAALEIDLLRLTVTRQGSSERWWPNPNPAGGHAP